MEFSGDFPNPHDDRTWKNWRWEDKPTNWFYVILFYSCLYFLSLQ